ncbi:unnamed protein product, partial [Scytosiphon promiscuus]
MLFSSAIRALLWASLTAKAVRAHEDNCDSDTLGHHCEASEYNVESGCAVSEAEGVCIPLADGRYDCMTSDTPPTVTACVQAGCECFGSLCVEPDCTDPC